MRSDRPSPGTALLAEQHALLEGRLQALRGSLASAEPADLEGPLSDLLSYLSLHFQMEEEIMRMHEYPRLQEHCRAHASFQRKVQELHDNLESSDRKMLEVLIHLLERWLERHESEQDAALLNYLQAG